MPQQVGRARFTLMSFERAWLSASELMVVFGAVPRAFRAFRSLLRDQKELLQASVRTVPLADVRSTLEEHADYLGLNLRNTKYIAPKVSGINVKMQSSNEKWCMLPVIQAAGQGS